MAAAAAAAAAAVAADAEGAALREKVVNLIAQKTELPDVMCKDMEIGIFNWAIKRADDLKLSKNWRNKVFRKTYESKARSVVSNVDPTGYVKNDKLLVRLRDQGEFKPHDIANMSPEHVFPDRWREVLDIKLQRDEYIVNAKPSAMTDQFKCGRCKNRQTTYVEAQLRSADEPATLFIQCCICGFRWRMG